MKNFFLLFICVFITLPLVSQTLFTYGNNTVSKAEFLRAYNKNKPLVTDKESALKEYLDLYIRFKLKVKDAKTFRLDTLPSLTADLQNFRSQIEETYLDDEKEIDGLVQEAFTRSQKDIHIAYLFIPLDKSTEAKDTIRAFNTVHSVYKGLSEKQYNTFNDAIKAIKDQPIQLVYADAGFVTVFTLPYEFENIVYNLKPGQVGKLYRSKKGYYIFQNIEERMAVGKMKAAQILLAIPPGASEGLKDTVHKQADSIYRSLLKSEDFYETAKKVSNDKMTFMNGGVMPEFGTGKFDTTFENKAFSLKNDSDISIPFNTEFGYHIIKRLSHIPVINDKKDAAYLNILRQQVKQDERATLAKDKFLKEIFEKLGYKKNNSINENDLWRMTDSFTAGKKIIIPGSLNEKTVLYSFTSNNVRVGDWLQFAKDNQNIPGSNKSEAYKDLMSKYVSQKATENYRANLEEYNSDFKYQLHEFEEGNMLFEIMERNVWSKASDDSIGLQKFYNENKKKYYWEASANAILISCANAKIAERAAEQLRAGKSWMRLAEEDSLQIQADSGRYELNQIPVVDRTNFTEGLVTAPVVNAADGTASLSKILKLYPANQQRSFEEARGLVINDYQNFLEQKWIDQLKKKYPVTINDKVFKTLSY